MLISCPVDIATGEAPLYLHESVQYISIEISGISYESFLGHFNYSNWPHYESYIASRG